MKRALQSLMFAFALLIAQQGAAWHALSHVGEIKHSRSDPKLPHGEQCTQCAAFSQIGAAHIGTAALPDMLPGYVQPCLPLPIAQGHGTAFFYRSRAPPVLV